MKEVNGIELYHIWNTNKGFLKIGQVLSYGNVNNFKKIYENEKQMPLYNDINYLKGVSNYFWKFFRESIIEDIRYEFYPEYPSRQSGLFLTDLSYVSSWVDNLNYNNHYQLVKLRLKGKLHKCDASLIDIHPNNSNVISELAHKYWSGEITGNSQKIEYVFEGTAEVIDIERTILVKN